MVCEDAYKSPIKALSKVNSVVVDLKRRVKRCQLITCLNMSVKWVKSVREKEVKETDLRRVC